MTKLALDYTKIKIRSTIGSVDLNILPESINIAEGVVIEITECEGVILLGKAAELGIKDSHCFGAHFLDIRSAVIDSTVR